MTTTLALVLLGCWRYARPVVRRRLLRLPLPGGVRWHAASADVALIAELAALGVSAGMTFTTALEHAAQELGDEAGNELRLLVRRLRTGGIAEVLESHEGDLSALALLVARAQLTGAPVLRAIESFVDSRHDEERSARLAAVRRLPVVLALPLTLLILPGFVMLVTAPAVVTTVQQLGIAGASP